MDLEEVEEEGKGVEANEEYSKILSEKELWARLDQLEKLEEQQDEEDRYTHSELVPAIMSRHVPIQGSASAFIGLVILSSLVCDKEMSFMLEIRDQKYIYLK